MATDAPLLTPADEAECAALVAEAARAKTPLAIRGGGTKRDIGRPAQQAGTLSSAGLAGITLHEPAEMVIAARAGTPLAEVEAALAETGQRLAFEPMDHRRLMASTGEPTLGGAVATNLSGPRRIVAGALRDSLIGLRFVNGRGEVVKSGGRVMKNVTGLDLVKLLAGSWGTLGLITEATFKVGPVPEVSATLMLRGLSDARGCEALRAAMASPFEPTGAALIPAPLEPKSLTLIRLEGFATFVRYRVGELSRLLAPFGTVDRVEGPADAPLWRDIRDAAFLAEPRDQAVWRVSVAPKAGPALVSRLAGLALRPGPATFCHYYDWSGGLVWLALPVDGDAGAGAIRAAVEAVGGGHATLVRAPAEMRARVPVFEPLTESIMAMQRRIKASLDPAGVLEPGRMYAGV